MSVLIILMIVSFGVAICFLGFFIWATRSGQFEDMQTPAMRMLADDEKTSKPTAEQRKEKL